MRQRRLENAYRNAELRSRVSARALNIRLPVFGESDQWGMRPQRYGTMARASSRCTTTAASSVGARLNRPPGASMRSSASKISASSEVGRCCVIRPHMASLVSSASMSEPRDDAARPGANASAASPFADPELDAALTTQGPLSDNVARRLIERGGARLDAG